MSEMAVIGVSTLVVTLLLIGGAIVYYLANLVRSAYSIKVTMQNDLQGGLDHLATELNKKSKWMRAELSDDITKMKGVVKQDIDAKLDTVLAQLQKVVTDLDVAARDERADLRQILSTHQKRLQIIENDLFHLKGPAPARKAKATTSADASGNTDGDDSSKPSIHSVTLQEFKG